MSYGFKMKTIEYLFLKYYVPSVQIKGFNVLIDGKVFFSDIPTKKEEQIYKQIIEMGTNNEYTTGNLSDYEYFSKYDKLFAIDVSRQIELENTDLKQKINFIGRLEGNEVATMCFIMEKSEETTLNLDKMLQQFPPGMRRRSKVLFRPHIG